MANPRSELFCVLPSKQEPRWIVPLDNRRVSAASLSLYQPSLFRAKAMKIVTIVSARLGLMKILWNRQISFSRDDSFIKDIFKQEDLSYAIFTGTLGSHRKTTVQVMDGTGAILGYIKVSGKPDVKQLLHNEAEMLRYLPQLRMNSGLFPQLIYRGIVDESGILVTDTVKTSKSRFTRKISKLHISFLAELFIKTSRLHKFNQSSFILGLSRRIATIDKNLPDVWRSRYQGGIQALQHKIGKIEMPFGVCHRDFTPWNTFFENKQLYVFDWEYAEKDYPPLLDIIHFILQDQIVVKKSDVEKLLTRLYSNKTLIEDYLAKVGVKYHLAEDLLLCYLLDISILYFERERKGFFSKDLRRTLKTWGALLDSVLGRIVP